MCSLLSGTRSYIAIFDAKLMIIFISTPFFRVFFTWCLFIVINHLLFPHIIVCIAPLMAI